jgi:hypothetical protein
LTIVPLGNIFISINIPKEDSVMATSEDAKLISAALLTLAASMVKIEKVLAKGAFNDESAKIEVTGTFKVMQDLIKKS